MKLMREMVIRKRTLSVDNENNQMVRRAEQTQKRMNRMILMTSLVTFLGHLPNFANSICLFFLQFEKVACIYSFTQIFFILFGYSFSFFVYIGFTKEFRQFYLKLITLNRFSGLAVGEYNSD